MAEGGRLEGALGGEPDDHAAEPAIAGVDPFAAAAPGQAPHDPALARTTSAYLDKQGRPIELPEMTG
jgi:hypothetical protein